MDAHGPNLNAQCKKIRHRIPQSHDAECDYLPGLLGKGGFGATIRLLMAVVIGTPDDPRVRVLNEDLSRFKRLVLLADALKTDIEAALRATPPRPDLAASLAATDPAVLKLALDGMRITETELVSHLNSKLGPEDWTVLSKYTRSEAGGRQPSNMTLVNMDTSTPAPLAQPLSGKRWGKGSGSVQGQFDVAAQPSVLP
eukprot:1942482-Amphidinium_carterae.1